MLRPEEVLVAVVVASFERGLAALVAGYVVAGSSAGCWLAVPVIVDLRQRKNLSVSIDLEFKLKLDKLMSYC